MDAITYAKSQFEATFGLFNTCVGGMDDAQYNFQPGGTCNTAAKSHLHAMTSLDFFVNGLIRGSDISWAPIAKEHKLPTTPPELWSYEANIPYGLVKEYSEKLQTQVLEYVATLKPEDLDRALDTKFFGTQTVAWILQLMPNHMMGHGGDAAAVKGMQGLKGLPF